MGLDSSVAADIYGFLQQMAMVDNSIYGETFLSFLTAVSITWVVLVSKKYDERDFGLNFSVLAEAL